jgi:hypothetical protein
LLLTLMFLVGASSVYGDGPPLNIHESVREPVSWTIPAGQCPSFPAGLSVSGTGERHAVVNTKENQDGSTRIIINDVVRGTAVDSNGDTYHFIYSNHSTQYIPASGLPIEFEMTDNFVLNGRGAAGNLEVGFVMRWTITDPNDPTWPPPNAEMINVRGEAFLCDPI